MKSVRLFSLALAGLMLCGTFAACKKDSGDGKETKTTDTRAGEYVADVPESDFGGATFTIMCRDPQMGWGEQAIVSFTQDEATTVLDDATYRRNSRLEKDFNIDFKFHTFTDANSTKDGFYQMIFDNILVGDDICDICIPGVIDAASLTTSGVFYDLSNGDVPYVNLNNPWWQKSLNDSMRLLNRQYFAINDALLNDKLDTYVMFFNKSLFDDNGIEYPYPMVESGEWTIDNFKKIVTSYGNDVNSNNNPDYEDNFGLVGMIYDVFYVGSGITAAYLDESGLPVLRDLDEKMENIYTKVFDIVKGSPYNTYSIGQEPLYNNDINETFAVAFDTKSLFMCGPMNFYFGIISDMESDVGLMPCPKYDENQKDYYHRAGYNGSTAVTVLTCTKNLERAGIILEALGAESKNYISPAFYERLLTDRYAQDEESKKMIQLVIDTEVFDLDQIFNWGPMLEKLQITMSSNQRSISTIFARYLQGANTKLEATIEEYNKLKDSGQ